MKRMQDKSPLCKTQLLHVLEHLCAVLEGYICTFKDSKSSQVQEGPHYVDSDQMPIKILWLIRLRLWLAICFCWLVEQVCLSIEGKMCFGIGWAKDILDNGQGGGRGAGGRATMWNSSIPWFSSSSQNMQFCCLVFPFWKKRNTATNALYTAYLWEKRNAWLERSAVALLLVFDVALTAVPTFRESFRYCKRKLKLSRLEGINFMLWFFWVIPLSFLMFDTLFHEGGSVKSI